MNAVDYWNECELDGYEIDTVLGEGAFSLVYRVRDTANGSMVAVKVAGPGIDTGSGKTGIYQSQALERMTNGFMEVKPDPIQLLKMQFKQLRSLKSAHVVEVYEYTSLPGVSYYEMELIGGSTFREVLSARADNLMEHMVQVLSAMSAMLSEPAFKYHGDLKPENILLDSRGEAHIIDPGFYGTIIKADGNSANCVITTPTYYPMLNADDLFAAGLMLWEAACGEVALDRDRNTKSFVRNCGAELEQRISGLERTGNFFLSPLRSIRKPSDINSSISTELEKILLKALRIQFIDDMTIDSQPGFETFHELRTAVAAIV